MKVSTNALTKRYCAAKGWPHESVQVWMGTRRHDLFGIADALVLVDDKLLWVQNCSYGSLKAHRDSIDKNPHLAWIDRSGAWLELWEWKRKKMGRKTLWMLRAQARANAAWCTVDEWLEPMDLYPPKPKASGRR